MKKTIALSVTALLALTLQTFGQTFGGGVPVSFATNAPLQNAPGVLITNQSYLSIPSKTLVLSGIYSVSEVVTGYYGFQVPTNYPLMPGTTNCYIVASFTNSFAGGTNNGTWTTNFPPLYNIPIQTIDVMGLNIGMFTNTAYVP